MSRTGPVRSSIPDLPRESTICRATPVFPSSTATTLQLSPTYLSTFGQTRHSIRPWRPQAIHLCCQGSCKTGAAVFLRLLVCPLSHKCSPRILGNQDSYHLIHQFLSRNSITAIMDSRCNLVLQHWDTVCKRALRRLQLRAYSRRHIAPYYGGRWIKARVLSEQLGSLA